MPRDILSEYGSDSNVSSKPGASFGGVEEAKPLPCVPPVGPADQHRNSPGLHGDNYGNCGTQSEG